MAEVWLLRHGERVDETDQAQQWYQSVPRTRRFDPDLTTQGAAQATDAAQTIATLRKGRPGFQRIYTSPLARTLSTASQAALVLGVEEVVVVPGLSECAAAVRKHGDEFWERLDFLPLDAMRQLCPQISRVESHAPRAFVECVAWVVETCRQAPEEPFLIVTHREGIRDLMGCHVRLPYCAIALFHPEQHSLVHDGPVAVAAGPIVKDAAVPSMSLLQPASGDGSGDGGSGVSGGGQEQAQADGKPLHRFPRFPSRRFSLKELLAPTGEPLPVPS